MRATYLFLLTISCTALMCRTGYAARSSTVREARRDAEHVAPAHSGKDRSDGHPSRASLVATNHPKQLPNNRRRFASGHAAGLHQVGSEKPAGAAKDHFVQNETINNALPVRPPQIVRPGAPSLNDTRHLGPNPAIIAGSANAKTGNAGAINGTHVNRKL